MEKSEGKSLKARSFQNRKKKFGGKKKNSSPFKKKI